MDLRRNFSSYSYESKMYPAIKSITKSAPAQWGWDRSITKDIIRTLCWDRVRTVNRRTSKSSLAAAKSQQNPAPISTGIAESTARRAHIFSSDEDEVQIRPKLPTKTVPRASIPPIANMKYPPTTPSKLGKQNLPITPPVGPSWRINPTSPTTRGIRLHKSQVSPRPYLPITTSSKDRFSVTVKGQIISFPKDVSYIEFDARINSYIPVGHDDIRCYRAMAGSNRDREWKPLGYKEELESVIRLCSNVGVELTIKKKSSYYNSDAEEGSDSNLYSLPQRFGAQTRMPPGVSGYNVDAPDEIIPETDTEERNVPISNSRRDAFTMANKSQQLGASSYRPNIPKQHPAANHTNATPKPKFTQAAAGSRRNEIPDIENTTAASGGIFDGNQHANAIPGVFTGNHSNKGSDIPVKRKRGRPRKIVEPGAADKPKKPRGRPRKVTAPVAAGEPMLN
ncbi:hypothetical protein Q9L58_009445, partial [Maublancomyces gigas]